MFNSNHYMPILKWKRAEQGALQALTDEQKKHITPLVQFVMPKQAPHEQFEDVIKKFEEQLLHIPKKISEVWGSEPIFVDFSLLFTTPLKVKSLNTILRVGRKLGAAFIPVLHLNDDPLIKKAAYVAAKESGSGICLRLICPDLDSPELHQKMTEFLSAGGLSEKDIDLLVDIKEVEENGDKYTRYYHLGQKISHLQKYRTFIFAAGAFPQDLSKFRIDEENLIPRADWTNWKSQANDKDLKRRPAFADYAIQHPIYKEALQFFHPTSSIKYTLDNEWLIMKGKKLTFEMYLANAAELVKDRRFFYGKDFSDGDKYISEKADHFNVYIKNRAIKGTGSTETWLKAGINHHLVLVAHQVSKLL